LDTKRKLQFTEDSGINHFERYQIKVESGCYSTTRVADPVLNIGSDRFLKKMLYTIQNPSVLLSFYYYYFIFIFNEKGKG